MTEPDRLTRAIDVSAATGILIIGAPVWALIAVLVRMTSGRPVLHRAVRVGRGGVPFTLLKFRTMRATPVDEVATRVTGAGDARVTRIGNWLRRSKLDEIPQLVNVLRGEMSLVGPRPEDPAFVALYTEAQLRLLEQRPGITSPASLAYRHEEQLLADSSDVEQAYVEEVMPAKLAMELAYFERRSLLSDFRVLARTASTILRPHRESAGDQFTVAALPAFETRDVNPYQWLLYTAMTDQGTEVVQFTRGAAWSRSVDVVHVHWPEGLLTIPGPISAALLLSRFLSKLWLAKLRGKKVVWTIHNLRPHAGQHRLLERIYWAGFVPAISGHISLTDAAQTAALARFPTLAKRPGTVIPIGHYRDIFPRLVSRRSARSELGLDPSHRVVVFVGRLHPYKNVSDLIRVFRDVNDPCARLLVRGSCDSAGLAKEIEEGARGDDRISAQTHELSDNEMATVLAAADVVAMPYRSILNSSTAVLALSFDRLVLAPAMGSIPDIVDAVGQQWALLYEGELDAAAIRDALTKSAALEGQHVALDQWDWSTLGADTNQFLRSLLV